MQFRSLSSTARTLLSCLVSSGYPALDRISCSAILAIMLGWSPQASAQLGLAPNTTDICEIDLAALKSNHLRTDRNLVTADTVSPQGMTVPSLWWTSEQFPAKLVTNWIANRHQKQIYLIVNTQYWNLLDYIDRYQAIDRFGRVAHSYGYALKICNSQKIALARYTCTSIVSRSETTRSNSDNGTRDSCQIWLNINGQDGMGVRTN